MAKAIPPFLNGEEGFTDNQGFVDVLFFFLAANSLMTIGEHFENPDIRMDKALPVILGRLDAIEKQQKQIIDILEKK